MSIVEHPYARRCSQLVIVDGQRNHMNANVGLSTSIQSAVASSAKKKKTETIWSLKKCNQFE